MGRSFYKPDTRNTIEDYKSHNTLSHAVSGMDYTMTERNGRFYQKRSTRGFNGAETNVFEEQVDYVIGSGNHARAYLHRTAQGRLVELPVSWYVEQSGYWAMTTSFDRADQPDMHGVINTQCMSCHNGYPSLGDTAAKDAAADNRFPEKLPEGIDCQRCHGPGRAHVDAANKPHASKEVIRASIVNPAKLTRERQMDVCMQCHLETSNPHAAAEIKAYERDLFSYRPGESLAAYKIFFERITEPTEEGSQNAHAAYGLRKSACYLQTQMTCLTCHNPHDIPHGEEATKGYISTCEKCHAAVTHTVALSPKENCITCHMPKRRTQGAVHLILTDHYIQRRRPPGNLLAPLHEAEPRPSNAPVTFYYPDPKQPTASQLLYLAIAQVDDGDGVQGLQHLRELVEQQKTTAAEPYLELARAYDRRDKHTEAVYWYEQALQHKPKFLPATRELPTTLLASGQTVRAIEVLKQGIAAHPNDDVLLTELANASLREGLFDGAATALQQVLQIDPERADAYNLKGLLELRRNNQTAAEQSFREALRLQPNLIEASNNLASLLTGQHQFAEAKYLYQETLKRQPAYADAHHGLGLLLILQGSIPAALPELKAAAQLQPGSATLHGDYADALAAQGQVQLAAAEYTEVLRLHPGQTDAQLGLATALLRQGRRLEAYPLLLKVVQSGNPDFASMAAQMLQTGVAH
jgi:Flp pilus assembly protein TadD